MLQRQLHGDSAALASRQTKSRISTQSRQSGVSHCHWNSRSRRWTVSWSFEGVRRHKLFTRARFMTRGKTAEQADNDALREAVAFRNTLVQNGEITEKKEATGGVKGVLWSREKKCWVVTIRQTIQGKLTHVKWVRFRPKDDTPTEIEKARLLAVAKRQKWEKKYYVMSVRAPEGPPPVERQSGVPGVTWRKKEGTWYVAAYAGNGRVYRGFTPKDDSPEEVERSRLAAVHCLRTLTRGKKRGQPRSRRMHSRSSHSDALL